MANADHLKRLADRAEYLMRRSQGQHVIVRDPVLIAERSRSLVLRCAVTGWDGVKTVVVKQYTADDERAFTDWASLLFLSELEDARGIAPHLYAGNPTDRIVVMEDLGGSGSLADVLDHSDVGTVVRLLRALAHTMARLVAASYRREQEFVRLRAAFPGATDYGRLHERARLMGGHGALKRWSDLLGLRHPEGFLGALGYVADVYAEPGPFLAFSHGDPAPSNNHILADRVRLLDFEYGGYRHALYDITAWYQLCPLPEPWVAEMEQVFRQALKDTPIGGLILDEQRYRDAWATMCAYRGLAMLTWLPHDLITVDREWTPGWTMREAFISTTLRLSQATAGITRLEPVMKFAAGLAAAAQSRWPELGNGALRWPGVTGYL